LAQSNGYTEVVTQHNSWYVLGLNYEHSQRLSFDVTYEFRRTDWGSEWTQSYIQGIAHYKPHNALVLNAGFLFLKHFPYGKQPNLYERLEYRPLVQATFSHKIGRFKIKNRHTLALRINEVKEYSTTQSSFERSGFQHMPWYRNRIALQVPLNHTKLMPKTFYLKLSEEVFFGFGTNAPENAFVQNRFISGAGYVINNRQKLEVDYLLQRLNKADGIRAERNHTSQFKYLLHFERRKK
jgi:hypothetical protein